MAGSPVKAKKVVGITGGIGCGKTFVASVMESMGAGVVDADAISREITKKGTRTYRRIVRAFGNRILDAKGAIDRPALARIVFKNSKSLKMLEALTHPEIVRRIKSGIRRSKKRIVVIDAPLLIEAGLAGIVDALVVVNASKERQIRRCIRKLAAGRGHVLRRMSSQMRTEEKIKMADFVIDNNGTKARTRAQARKLWREIAWK